MTTGIHTAHSSNPVTADAVAEIAAALPLETAAFNLLFHGPNHANIELEQGLTSLPGNHVYGCSTSGEITPAGYTENTLVSLSFPQEHFSCVARSITDLSSFGLQQARELVLSMQWELRSRAPRSNSANTFAILLIDSLVQVEEFVAAALGGELGNTHLIGASAGDNWQLQRTPVLFRGRLQDAAAVVLLVHSALEFRHYNFHNFVPSDQRGVITSATPSQRVVHQINGRPACIEYARLCGVDIAELDREKLSLFPAIITVGDRAYPRGFLEILDDGSLRCACAIDEGVVFRVADQVDYADQLQTALGRIRRDLGSDALILGFECAARKQLVQLYGLELPVTALFGAHNVWGFSCMGEQSSVLNVNNSFNCIAFRAHR
ncbi:FIST N-terminal domain-containing protein [Haliea sp. E1-2-M8]|uniref:FIST signal transduction protein n=1 Tax=Haliea sp. E1-2-M8 TaxID=3064706 RepID=UPI00271FEF0C|nr:FIST N-terminal domain-containing protein [Haliea sp. E1-2-M8]MDO8862650.1 FIST N-terminal domain-containing protein [Haliea sp. E1-2-M8]